MTEEPQKPGQQYTSVSIVYGDLGSEYYGIQTLGTNVNYGKMKDKGFTLEDLELCKANFEKIGCECDIIHLNPELINATKGTTEFEVKAAKTQQAYVLRVKNAVNSIYNAAAASASSEADANHDTLLREQLGHNWDKQGFMYGRVVNKKARFHLSYADTARDPDYENGKGRIVAWNDVPLTSKLHLLLPQYIPNCGVLDCEANQYEDVTKYSGIGFHGDTERRKVIVVKLGCVTPVHFHWFFGAKPIGNNIEIPLDHGDLYIMSEKTAGTDWKSRGIFSLRHACGAKKFTTVTSGNDDGENKKKKRKFGGYKK